MRWMVLALLPYPAMADSLVATRVIPAQSVIVAEDVTLVAAAIPGALSAAEAALGMEARVTLYPGRAIRAGDVGPPALVERNGAVILEYRAGALIIRAEGRALARATSGQAVRVMNLASRTTVTGHLGPDGTVRVGP
ncbi:MAG: flagellar basal body P-ring formation chaperone FlgA [Gemmobacter sp.]